MGGGGLQNGMGGRKVSFTPTKNDGEVLAMLEWGEGHKI